MLIHSVDSLNLTRQSEEARTFGYSIVDRLLAYQARLADLPVVRNKTQKELRSSLWETLPAPPQDPITVRDRVENEIFSSTNHETRPRFFAFIPGPSNFLGALAEFLRTGYNIFSGSWLEGSAPAIAELVTLDWIRRLAGYLESAGGTFLSGGSLANLSALVTARDALLQPQEYHNAVVYGSDQTHSSITRAMRILGFQKEQITPHNQRRGFSVAPRRLERSHSERSRCRKSSLLRNRKRGNHEYGRHRSALGFS